MFGAFAATTIVSVAPAEPCDPDTVTPCVYSSLPELSFVALNLKGCDEVVVSERSNIYVSPRKKVNVGIITPSI